MNKSLQERFWEKVNIQGKNECWNWEGSSCGNGYGGIRIGHSFCLAHRCAWILTNGPIPNGMLVLHKCNNKKCVNPLHLYIGDQLDNVRDGKRAGVYKGGAWGRRGNGRLTDIEVVKIREEYASGKYALWELAYKYNRAKSSISYIINRKTYKDI